MDLGRLMCRNYLKWRGFERDLNDITSQYQIATVGWYQALFPVASRLFGILAIIELLGRAFGGQLKVRR